jgi:hypothetical protein
MTTESRNDKFNEDISLKELIVKSGEVSRYLWSNWLIIFVIGIIGAIIGFTYASFQKTVYTATTTFVLEESGSGNGGLATLGGLASIAGVDLGGSSSGLFKGDNILELYKSRSMIEKTLFTSVDVQGKKDLLINRYIEFNKLKEEWDKNPLLKNIEFNLNQGDNQFAVKIPNRLKDSLVGIIVDDINNNYLMVSKLDKKLSIIKAVVKSKDEFFAKTFNEEIVNTVNDFYIQTKTKKSLNNIKILQQKTDSVRAVMNGAIFSAASVADATPNLNPTKQIQRSAPIQRSQFSAETNKSILEVLVQNLEMSRMSLMKESPLIQVVDQPVYPLVKDKFSKLKGIVSGGLIFAFLSIVIFIGRFIIKGILNDNNNY